MEGTDLGLSLFSDLEMMGGSNADSNFEHYHNQPYVINVGGYRYEPSSPTFGLHPDIMDIFTDSASVLVSAPASLLPCFGYNKP